MGLDSFLSIHDIFRNLFFLYRRFWFWIAHIEFSKEVIRFIQIFRIFLSYFVFLLLFRCLWINWLFVLKSCKKIFCIIHFWISDCKRIVSNVVEIWQTETWLILIVRLPSFFAFFTWNILKLWEIETIFWLFLHINSKSKTLSYMLFWSSLWLIRSNVFLSSRSFCFFKSASLLNVLHLYFWRWSKNINNWFNAWLSIITSSNLTFKRIGIVNFCIERICDIVLFCSCLKRIRGLRSFTLENIWLTWLFNFYLVWRYRFFKRIRSWIGALERIRRLVCLFFKWVGSRCLTSSWFSFKGSLLKRVVCWYIGFLSASGTVVALSFERIYGRFSTSFTINKSSEITSCKRILSSLTFLRIFNCYHQIIWHCLFLRSILKIVEEI